jgi:hypothetical protein
MVGGGGGALQTTTTPLPPHNTAARIPTYLNTTTHNRATTLMYIKLPMYLLFIWHFLRRGTSLLGALEGVGPENLDFFGP